MPKAKSEPDLGQSFERALRKALNTPPEVPRKQAKRKKKRRRRAETV